MCEGARGLLQELHTALYCGENLRLTCRCLWELPSTINCDLLNEVYPQFFTPETSVVLHSSGNICKCGALTFAAVCFYRQVDL